MRHLCLIFLLPIIEAYRQHSPRLRYNCPANLTLATDGFPCPTEEQLQAIEERAHGTILEQRISDLGDFAITYVEQSAHGESTQARFFGYVAENISAGDVGFEANQSVLDTYLAMQAQAEVRAISFNNLLTDNNIPPIFACDVNSGIPASEAPYQPQSLAIANIVAHQFLVFTSASIATSQNRIITEDAGAASRKLVALFTSLALAKGEQIAFFRSLRGFDPVAAGSPFPLATGTAEWQFYFSEFTQPPGTCEAIDRLRTKLITFGTLQVLQLPPYAFPVFGQEPVDTVFTANGTLLNATAMKWLLHGELYGTYIHSVDKPLSVPLLNWTQTGKLDYDIALPFPAATNKLYDGILLTLTRGKGFETALDAMHATVAGPDIVVLN